MRGVAWVVLLASGVHAIWPLPTEYDYGDGVLFIKKGEVDVQYNGAGSVSALPLYF